MIGYTRSKNDCRKEAIAITRSALYVLLCYILWGLLPIYWKQLSSVNSLYILASRITFSMIFCGLLLLLYKQWDKVKALRQDKKQLKLLAWGSILITINWGSYIFAVNSGHILDASLAYYLNPILVIMLGAIFFGERLNRWQLLAVLLSATGVLYSVFSYGKIPVYALVIGGSFALYGAVKKQIVVGSMVSTFMETALVFPLFLLIMAVLEVQGSGCIGQLTGWQYLLIPLAGVVTSVPLLVYAKGIQHTSLALSGILMYVNPTLQLLIGVFLYHEPFTHAQAITFLFVWIAVMIFVGDSVLSGKRRKNDRNKQILSSQP